MSDPMATPSDDGNTITCKCCLGKGKMKGIVTMRRPFSESAWDEHCRGKKHREAAVNILAEKRVKHLKKKTQKSMATFFSAKKKPADEATGVDANDAATAAADGDGNVVDLSANAPPIE